MTVRKGIMEKIPIEFPLKIAWLIFLVLISFKLFSSFQALRNDPFLFGLIALSAFLAGFLPFKNFTKFRLQK